MMDRKVKIAGAVLGGYLLLRLLLADDEHDKTDAEDKADTTLVEANLPPMLGAAVLAADPITNAPLPIVKVANKFNYNKRTQPIRGIVIHYTLTKSAKQTKAVLEKRGFSTNYEVDQDGKIYEYLDPATRVAWATGGGANAQTIGIDVTRPYSQHASPDYPPMQMIALRSLVRYLAKRFDFPIVVAPDGIKQRWGAWKGKGYTVFRHRNFVATACPGKLPIEKVAT